MTRLAGTFPFVLLLLTATVPAAAQTDTPAAPARSVLDGVYTALQADRGERSFRRVCAECHVASEFTGSGFRYAWSGRTVGDFFDVVRTQMPYDKPGSLDRRTYADILAYVLRRNDFPAGDVELPSDDTGLGRIVITRKPDSEH